DQLERAARILGGDDVSGDERGQELRAEARGEREDDEREHVSRVTEVERERRIMRPALLEREHDDEEDRQQRRRPETDVGPLLRDELAQLPTVGGERRRPHATALSGAAPSVSSKKRSSSVARSGTRAAIPSPASTSARERATTAASSAGKRRDRKSTRLNSSHGSISYAVFCLKK